MEFVLPEMKFPPVTRYFIPDGFTLVQLVDAVVLPKIRVSGVTRTCWATIPAYASGGSVRPGPPARRVVMYSCLAMISSEDSSPSCPRAANGVNASRTIVNIDNTESVAVRLDIAALLINPGLWCVEKDGMVQRAPRRSVRSD